MFVAYLSVSGSSACDENGPCAEVAAGDERRVAGCARLCARLDRREGALRLLLRARPAPDVPEERYAKSKAIARFLLDHGADPTEALTAVAVVPEKDFDEMLALVARAGRRGNR